MSASITFAGYYLAKRLDSGGRIEFYEAHEGGGATGTAVLLIRLPQDDMRWPPWADPRLATLLRHPNIVRMLDYGVHDRRPVAILEFVPGRDLREVLADTRRLPTSLCWFIVREICNALAAALGSRELDGKPLHWTHGQVCPRAVRVSRTGEVKLGWFGLGRLKPEIPMAADGPVDERLRFLSPEQAGGRVYDTPDPTVDVFLLGAVLHELVTHAPLVFGSTAAEYLHALRHYSQKTFSRTEGLVSPELARVAATMLARDPADRYRDATEALHALERVPEAEQRDTMAGQLAEHVVGLSS